MAFFHMCVENHMTCELDRRLETLDAPVIYVYSYTVTERLCFHRCLSVHVGRCTPPARQTRPTRQTRPMMATSVDGMHPTGMYSGFDFFFQTVVDACTLLMNTPFFLLQ